jgi:hypothetical protein
MACLGVKLKILQLNPQDQSSFPELAWLASV